MKSKYVFLFLLATLFIASCSIVPSVTEVTMLAGETTTITITELRWFSGSMIPIGGGGGVSTDPGIPPIEQGPSPRAARGTLPPLPTRPADIHAPNPFPRLGDRAISPPESVR